jgi:hypothetical protein
LEFREVEMTEKWQMLPGRHDREVIDAGIAGHIDGTRVMVGTSVASVLVPREPAPVNVSIYVSQDTKVAFNAVASTAASGGGMFVRAGAEKIFPVHGALRVVTMIREGGADSEVDINWILPTMRSG